MLVLDIVILLVIIMQYFLHIKILDKTLKNCAAQYMRDWKEREEFVFTFGNSLST